MKKGTGFIGIMAALLLLCAWSVRRTGTITKAAWLTGTWEHKTSRGSVYETWEKVNGKELSGKSFVVKEKDTLVLEQIRLLQRQDTLFYIPTVKDQNDGLPVFFHATSVSATQLIFENNRHDFPQIISYTKVNADSLVAVISGVEAGNKRTQTFPMKRVR